MPPGTNNYDPHRKAARVALAIILVVSVSGFFMGLRQTGNTSSSRDLAQIAAHPEEEHPDAPRARDYSRMHEIPKANHHWSNVLANLAPAALDVFASNAPASDEERARLLDRRLERRAFDGAPPVVPHPVDQMSAASCLACHGEGMAIKGNLAPKISHPPYSSCTQCHVPSNGVLAGGTVAGSFPPLAENSFSGLASYGKGERAFPGAPPAIPHPISMRADCASCHGSLGTVGLRTSHPWRQSCTQCHAPSASQDQRAFQAFIGLKP